MAWLYPWFVFAHLIGLVPFAISHGASAYMAFRIRSDRDLHTVASLGPRRSWPWEPWAC